MLRARALALASALSFALSALAGCAHHAAAGRRSETSASVAVEPVSEAEFPLALRAYYRMPLDDPERESLRGRLLARLELTGSALVEAEDYPSAVEHIARVSSLFTPGELVTSPPRSLGPVAAFVRARGERAGDEAPVLSALWLQAHLQPEDPAPLEYYRELRTWSEQARENSGVLTEPLDGLIEVLEEHVRITPGPEPLDDLAERYLERRRQLAMLLGTRPDDVDAVDFEAYREATGNLVNAPLDVAGLYLLHDEVGRALERVRAMRTVTGKEPILRDWLEDIEEGGDKAPETSLVLAYNYADMGRLDVAAALCRRAMREDPENDRFLRCLGWLASQQGDYVEATYDYAQAVRLAPEDRSLYDEALEVLANMLRHGLFEVDPAETRALADEAEALLEARMQRWPNAAPPVSLEDLELAVGMAEMSAGNIDAARERFERSLQISETVRGLVQLGQLEARLGELTKATVHLRRALDLTPHRSLDQASLRAQVLEYLGDIMRVTDEPSQARRLYEEGLGLWNAALSAAQDRAQQSAIQTRRGVLLERLGRARESVDAFEAAMAAAPDDRETYAQILSHMVVGESAPDFAASVLRRAQRQLTLAPEWKTYFALWVKAISARAGGDALPEVDRLLERQSRSDAWWGQLAKFGRGEIDYVALSDAASNRGEQTEADFYEATRLLAKGEAKAAHDLLQKVIDTQMVSFYEYQMALELLRD